MESNMIQLWKGRSVSVLLHGQCLDSARAGLCMRAPIGFTRLYGLCACCVRAAVRLHACAYAASVPLCVCTFVLTTFYAHRMVMVEAG